MDYKNVNDYEQLYLIGENDDEARERLLKKYHPIIISIARKYYDSYNEYGICMDDLVQEGNIGFMNAITGFNDTKNVLFYTFSTICVERQIAAYCRKYFNKKNTILNNAYNMEVLDEKKIDFYNLVSEDINSLNNPVTYLESDVLFNKIINFKNSLPMVQSLVFELRYNGFKYKEIARLLDISISVVDNCIHICKNKFLNEFKI